MARKKRDYARELVMRKRRRRKTNPKDVNGTKKTVARNKARAMMKKAGKVKKGDGKEVDHKRSLKKGGGNSKKNLRVVVAKKNSRAGGKSGNHKKKRS